MGITRKTKFGFPPQPTQGSTLTTRLVPLSTGAKPDEPWPIHTPGSAQSMTNYLPMDGALIPRSRLSSLNTIRTIASIHGITPQYVQAGGSIRLWVSDATIHGLVQSNGSISKASFVSAAGLGVAGITSNDRWQYATAYAANLNENMTIAAGGFVSYTTLIALYQTSGSASGLPLYSYLTSAPMAHCVGSFDNYLLAWNLQEVNVFPNRLRWCVRGNPSNWTGEGSGFEDLLDMRGAGTAVVGTSDQRFLLFSDQEIWVGVSAAYPAQFVFYPLDRNVGCVSPYTVTNTDIGIVFVGADNTLRVVPRGGGATQVLAPSLSRWLREWGRSSSGNYSYAVYNSTTKMYHLFMDTFESGTLTCVVVNVLTGEWGNMTYNSPTPISGTYFSAPQTTAVDHGVFFGSSTGTVYSLSSTISQENGATTACVWRSAAIAADMAGNYKQVVQVDVDYRSTSTATMSMQMSQDGGNTFGNGITSITLPTAAVGGRATAQVYVGGAFPAIHLASTATGYELHRMDVSMNIGGRK